MIFKKRKVRIAFAQIAPYLADVDRNLDKHIEYVDKAIAGKADMVLFPELSLSGYSLKDATPEVVLSQDDDRLKPLLEKSKKITIICGGVELSDDFEIFNTQWCFEDGRILNKHRKVYLPTYGVFEEERYFSSGNRFRAFESKLLPMGVMVCEDLWHPASGLILALDGAWLLVVPAAGLTRGLRGEKKPQNVHAWDTLASAMAITTTSYVAFINRVGSEDGLVFWGGSQLVGPDGEVVGRAKYYDEQLFSVEMDLHKLRHARVNSTMLSDEKLPVLIEEFQRIHKKRLDY